MATWNFARCRWTSIRTPILAKCRAARAGFRPATAASLRPPESCLRLSSIQKADLRAQVGYARGIAAVAHRERNRILQPIVPDAVRIVRGHREGILLRAQLAPEGES